MDLAKIASMLAPAHQIQFWFLHLPPLLLLPPPTPASATHSYRHLLLPPPPTPAATHHPHRLMCHPHGSRATGPHACYPPPSAVLMTLAPEGDVATPAPDGGASTIPR
jgi:hypothetical protein